MLVIVIPNLQFFLKKSPFTLIHPIFSWLIKASWIVICVQVLAVVNSSLREWVVPPSLEVMVCPIFKGPSLDSHCFI